MEDGEEDPARGIIERGEGGRLGGWVGGGRRGGGGETDERRSVVRLERWWWWGGGGVEPLERDEHFGGVVVVLESE